MRTDVRPVGRRRPFPPSLRQARRLKPAAFGPGNRDRPGPQVRQFQPKKNLTQSQRVCQSLQLHGTKTGWKCFQHFAESPAPLENSPGGTFETENSSGRHITSPPLEMCRLALDCLSARHKLLSQCLGDAT